MCTIITVNGKFDRDKLIEQVKKDQASNPHGFACLTVSDGKYSMLRGMDYAVMYPLLLLGEFDRVWIHTRFATQGEKTLENCHGWSTGEKFVMHNGFIDGKEAQECAVDSQAIVKWLETGGIDAAMVKLRKNSYANVFIIDTRSDEYHVHRSKTGSLHTDGKGNYSTNAFGPIKHEVPKMTFRTVETDTRRFASYGSYTGRYHNTGKHGSWKKGSSYGDWWENSRRSSTSYYGSDYYGSDYYDDRWGLPAATKTETTKKAETTSDKTAAAETVVKQPATEKVKTILRKQAQETSTALSVVKEPGTVQQAVTAAINAATGK